MRRGACRGREGLLGWGGGTRDGSRSPRFACYALPKCMAGLVSVNLSFSRARASTHPPPSLSLPSCAFPSACSFRPSIPWVLYRPLSDPHTPSLGQSWPGLLGPLKCPIPPPVDGSCPSVRRPWSFGPSCIIAPGPGCRFYNQQAHGHKIFKLCYRHRCVSTPAQEQYLHLEVAWALGTERETDEKKRVPACQTQPGSGLGRER